MSSTMNKMKDKNPFACERKFDVFSDFFNNNHRKPISKEVYEDINIGILFDSLKQAKRKGKKSPTLDFFEPYLIQWFGEHWHDDKYRKLEVLTNFFETKKRRPRPSEIHNGVNVGNLMQTLKQDKRHERKTSMLVFFEPHLIEMFGDRWYE